MESTGTLTITGSARFLAVIKAFAQAHADRETRWYKFHLRGGEPDASMEKSENIPIDRLMATGR